jgi:hypothetical protein
MNVNWERRIIFQIIIYEEWGNVGLTFQTFSKRNLFNLILNFNYRFPVSIL